MTTLGKYRHLMQCSTHAGHICALAIDHRDNLLDELNKYAPAPVTDAAFTAFKQMVIRYLAPEASALLTDPVYGLGVGIAGGTIGGKLGLLCPLEVTDYSLHPSRRKLRLIPDWSVGKIKRVGAQGVKLLVYYHPDTDAARDVREAVSRVVDECARHDIPLFLEPIAYSPDESKHLTNADLTAVVVETARAFSALGVDVLKLQFPLDAAHEPDETVWRAALAQVDAACAVPWTLLSAGVSYEVFLRQSQLACEAGASGLIVGRAIWLDAVKLHGEAREDFLGTVARQRMVQLANTCANAARDWRETTAAPDVSGDWYASYSE